jgi:hypothetical protein
VLALRSSSSSSLQLEEGPQPSDAELVAAAKSKRISRKQRTLSFTSIGTQTTVDKQQPLAFGEIYEI